MTLSADELEAFFQVARAGGFSKAAKVLFITQSAVSQRISKLEEALQTTLLVRSSRGIALTPAGQQLLRYCQLKEQLESQVVQGITAPRRVSELYGHVRIAAFSSVLRSAVLPALAPLLRENPNLQLDARSAELKDLLALLRHGEVDYAVLDHQVLMPELESCFLGEEWNVLVAPLSDGSQLRFLDHDTEDTCTERFRALQDFPLENAPRHYLDDVYGIIEGVELGLGRAVVSAHLLKPHHQVEIVPGCAPMRVAVWLHFLRQAWDTPLHAAVVSALRERVPEFLSPARL